MADNGADKTCAQVVEDGDFFVVFQPLIEIQTSPMRVFAYETLVRATVPQYPSPPAFINAAIEEGVIGDLGRAIRARAIKGCPDHPLFINIDPNEFDTGFLVRPDDPAFAHGHEVFLEITESVPLSHHEYCHGVLNEIRRRGLNLAVDDLGAGYSNLKYIADLSPEIVKLDRELIKNLTKGSRLHKLVASIAHMCVSMGAKVVAEGVETVEEFHAVQEAGVNFVQGYFFAKPQSPPPEVDADAIVADAS